MLTGSYLLSESDFFPKMEVEVEVEVEQLVDIEFDTDVDHQLFDVELTSLDIIALC